MQNASDLCWWRSSNPLIYFGGWVAKGGSISHITDSQQKNEYEARGCIHVFFCFAQLPPELPVVWNKRLLKTAGLCKLKRMGDKHTAAIELSTKVCDTAGASLTGN